MIKTLVRFGAIVLAVYMFLTGIDLLVSAISIWTGLLVGLAGSFFLGYGVFKYAGLAYLIVVYIFLTIGITRYFFSPDGGIGVFAGAGYAFVFNICFFAPFVYFKRKESARKPV